MKLKLVLIFCLATTLSMAQINRTALIESINQFEGVKIDKFGNLEVDLGSANSGRFSVNINEVDIKLEVKGEEKGCADYCPERSLILFECKDEKCVSDPTMSNYDLYDSAVGSFRIESGLNLYLKLVNLKYLDFIDLSAVKIKQ